MEQRCLWWWYLRSTIRIQQFLLPLDSAPPGSTDTWLWNTNVQFNIIPREMPIQLYHSNLFSGKLSENLFICEDFYSIKYVYALFIIINQFANQIKKNSQILIHSTKYLHIWPLNHNVIHFFAYQSKWI